jgi:hypothetical protein
MTTTVGMGIETDGTTRDENLTGGVIEVHPPEKRSIPEIRN